MSETEPAPALAVVQHAVLEVGPRPEDTTEKEND